MQATSNLVPKAGNISGNYIWKQMVIGGGGWVTGLAVHPTTPNLVFGRTDVGGVFKWNPTTRSWTQLLKVSKVAGATIGNGDYNVESIALSASNDQVLYIAVGNGDGGRILKSTNQGATWTEPSSQRWYIEGNGDYRMNGERLAVDPANSDVVYFGSRTQGLWKTTDGGANWTLIPTDVIPVGTVPTGKTPPGVRWVLFDPTGGTLNGLTRRIYVGVSGYGVYRTDDAGATWTRIYTITVSSTSEQSVPLTAKMGGRYLYTLLEGWFRKYDPDSNTWTPIRNVGNWGAITIDPKNPNLMLVTDDHMATSGHLWRSTDGGATWSAALNLNIAPANCDPQWICNTDVGDWLSIGDLQFDPFQNDLLWFAEGMGMWQLTNLAGNTLTMHFISRGIEEMVPADIVAPPGGAPVITVMDRQGFYKPDPDAYPTRTLVDGSFATGCSLDYAGRQPNNLVVTLSRTNIWPWDGRAAYSSDGGKTWSYFSSLPDDNKGGNIAISANNPNNIVWLPSSNQIGTPGPVPYVTFDRGASWKQSNGIDPNLSLHELVWWVGKRALDADKVQDGVFYLIAGHTNPGDTTQGTFYVSTDGGQNWSAAPYAPPCSGTAATDCHVWGQLRAVPGYAGHVWASAVKGGLWYTTDAGQTPWKKVAGVERAQAFGFGKALPGKTYPAIYLFGTVNGQTGYWRSGDMGATWDLIAVYPLDYYDENRTINGDMNIAGRVYIGMGGISFVYGDDATLSQPGPLPSPWQTQDVGSVGATGNASYSNGVFTVKGSGVDIWDTSDGFRFVYQTLSGDGEIRARVTGVQNTDPWAKAGVMIRETLDANSKHAMMVLTPGNGLAFQRRTSTGGSSEHTSGGAASAPYWVRLVRSGKTFTAYKSSDGNNWTQVGSATISMASNVYIGLAVTAHNYGTLCTATFDNVSVSSSGPTPTSVPPTSTPTPTSTPIPGLPSPWQTQDVGSVGATGSASYSDGVFTVKGSGMDIWDTSDGFRFVYQTLSGDGEIRARVTGVQNTDPWAKAGVMIRETLDANSKHAMMVLTPGNGLAFQRRTSTGGSSEHTSGGAANAPYWVRLVRSGNTFTAYKSSDGNNWTQVGSATISMASNVYIGLAVTAHSYGTLCTATFDNVNVSTGTAFLVIYDDSTTWDNWSWNSTIDLGNTSPVYAGSKSIAVTYNAAWAALSLRKSPAQSTNGYNVITFWAHGGSSGTRQIHVYVQTADSGGESTKINVDVPANQWTQFTIPLSSVGNPSQIARISFQDRTGGAQSMFYIDEVKLVGN